MHIETIELLRCPNGCGEPLSLSDVEAAGNSIKTGTLLCSSCGRAFPIEGGIGLLLPSALTDAQTQSHTAVDTVEIEKKRSEMAARDEQVGAYDKMKNLALFGKIEIPVTLAQLKPQASDLLLEAGSGTGRMTAIFSQKVKSLVSVDFSRESLKVCRGKLEAAGIQNVDLIQADVCALPFATERFDRVVSCQVLEHIPTPESRSRMIAELARVVKSGGCVVLSAYQHSLLTRLFGQKEGMHEGGIPFFRFSRRELAELLGQSLRVRGMTGALVYHYLARCEKEQ